MPLGKPKQNDIRKVSNRQRMLWAMRINPTLARSAAAWYAQCNTALVIRSLCKVTMMSRAPLLPKSSYQDHPKHI